jgi:nucleoside-diphosphate-sugar epimerase
MRNALVGFTGFVGQNLKVDRFDDLINSSNIKNFKGQEFDLLVVAAGDARKWYANQNPSKDLIHILNLYADLKNIRAKKVILMSTIDVYPDYHSDCVYNENTTIYSDFPYGMHRLMLEKLLQMTFQDVSIIRLPGLMGKNLKKNLIFDICNNRVDQLNNYNLDSFFQYFALSKLDEIIDMVLDSNSYDVLNLVSEPISVRQIANLLNISESLFSNTAPKINYNIQTVHSQTGYIFDSHFTRESIKSFYYAY